MNLKYLWHAFTCRLSFRVRHGDGTLTERMTHDCAQDYIDDEPGTADVIVFDPEGTLKSTNPHNIPPSQIDYANH